MRDIEIALIARQLAKALMTRARTRLAEDQKIVLELQTQLCQEVLKEELEKDI